jgi:hypothetical protein
MIVTFPRTSSCFEPSGGSGKPANSSAVIKFCATGAAILLLRAVLAIVSLSAGNFTLRLL